MKKSTRQMMVIAAGLVASAALSTLVVSGKKKNNPMRRRDTWIGKCSNEKLEMVKGKLQKHKSRLETAIQKIDTRLGDLQT